MLVMLGVIAFSLFGYCSKRSVNPITGETQYVSMTVDQEIALGLQAKDEMASQYGDFEEGTAAASLVNEVGHELLQNSDAGRSSYRFEFHLLQDPKTINAFALPGGQVFITRALFDRLQTRGQLAGVLGHEIGHVIARHGAQQMAKAELSQGITGAMVMGAYDPSDPKSAAGVAMVQLISKAVNLKFGRNDELQADKLGVRFMSQSGYDPRAMIGVMKILEQAGGGGRQPEFFSTHPNPENRIDRIKAAINEYFPNGLPSGLKP